MWWNLQKINFKRIRFIPCLLACLIIVGCGSAVKKNNSLMISVADCMLNYRGNVKLEQVNLKPDEVNEIIALYQEAGENIGYVDSLLIAEKYSQGLGVNAFAQSNLNTLYDYDLTIENLKKTQINIKDKKQNKKAVLLEYDITNGFIESVPVLYMSQLFVENDSNIVLISYSTENSQARTAASNMLKNIK